MPQFRRIVEKILKDNEQINAYVDSLSDEQISNILQIDNTLQETNSERDERFIQFAYDLHAELLKAIRTASIFRKSIRPDGYLFAFPSVNLYLKLFAVGMNGDYDDKTNTLTLFILPGIMKNKDELELYINKQNVKSIIIHEITHKLDIDEIIAKGHIPPPPVSSENLKAYYNSSLEFNAFSNDLLDAMNRFFKVKGKSQDPIDVLINKIGDHIKALWKYDAEYFYRFRQFLKHLTKRNRRKLLKKLLYYYMGHK